MPGMTAMVGRASVMIAVVAASAGCASGAVHATTDVGKPAVVAQVGKLPGLYLGAGAGPWSGPKIRPKTLFLGADWNILKLHWTTWNARRAGGRGFYDACAGPAGGPPCVKFWGTVTATRVQRHHGHKYFAIMKVVGTRRQVRLVMNTKLGWWQQAR